MWSTWERTLSQVSSGLRRLAWRNKRMSLIASWQIISAKGGDKIWSCLNRLWKCLLVKSYEMSCCWNGNEAHSFCALKDTRLKKKLTHIRITLKQLHMYKLPHRFQCWSAPYCTQCNHSSFGQAVLGSLRSCFLSKNRNLIWKNFKYIFYYKN